MKPNIILITLDALRADHLGFMGYKKNTSPFLDSFVKKSVVFKNAYSTGAATPQSFAGIMTSTYPLDFGGYSRNEINKRTLVSEAFQKAGYRTLGFHSNAYLSEYFGYGRGWDVFHYLSHFKNGAVRPAMRAGTWQARVAKKIFDWQTKGSGKRKIIGFLAEFLEALISTFRKIYNNLTGSIPSYYTAFEMNEEVKKEIKGKHEEPIFLWVHYMDAHDPYGLFLRKGSRLIPKIKSYLCDYMMSFFGIFERFNKIFSGFYAGVYDEGIRNIDRALEELFEHLSRTGVLNDETAVFITADHGEEFGEHGGFIHMQKAFAENINVPLIVSAPKKFAGEPGAVEMSRSLVDLAPTMLSYAGIPQPKNFRGKNLFDKEERDVIVELSNHEVDLSGINLVARAIISEKRKLIKMKKCELLFSVDDKKDKKDLSESESALRARLEKKLAAFSNIR